MWGTGFVCPDAVHAAFVLLLTLCRDLMPHKLTLCHRTMPGVFGHALHRATALADVAMFGGIVFYLTAHWRRTVVLW